MNYLTVENVTPSTIHRIFSKISIDLATGCWNWTAALNTYGYGCIWYEGRQEQAHRLMYAWFNGPIPQGIASDIPVLDHVVCNNPRCCNPAHLQLTTTVGNLARTGSVSAVNRRKTHCIHGHLLPTEDNRPTGGRYCLVCRAAQSHRNYLRRKNIATHAPPP